MFSNWENELLIVLNIVIAAILTGLIGIERELHNKPAGFRTNMIVGSAAALLISLGEIIIANYTGDGLSDHIMADPTRVIEAIIVGISFIGAGTILKGERDEKVYYLTTAATVLFSAGIGISVALHQYVLSVSATLLIFLINRISLYFYDKK